MASMLSWGCCCSQIGPPGAGGSGGSLLVCYHEVVSDKVSRCQGEVEEGPRSVENPPQYCILAFVMLRMPVRGLHWRNEGDLRSKLGKLQRKRTSRNSVLGNPEIGF